MRRPLLAIVSRWISKEINVEDKIEDFGRVYALNQTGAICLAYEREKADLVRQLNEANALADRAEAALVVSGKRL